MDIKVVPAPDSSPPGKLADVELHFSEEEQLAGLKLVGFGVWESRSTRGRSVTFPSRQYTVNGERRNFTLLRAVSDRGATDSLRDHILEAYIAAEGVPSPLADRGPLPGALSCAPGLFLPSTPCP